ncbi:MAG: hypothetical protein E7K04_04125 [Helicobacter sp.]|nr:hypothetical protein [Helicobacter sp.]
MRILLVLFFLAFLSAEESEEIQDFYSPSQISGDYFSVFKTGYAYAKIDGGEIKRTTNKGSDFFNHNKNEHSIYGAFERGLVVKTAYPVLVSGVLDFGINENFFLGFGVRFATRLFNDYVTPHIFGGYLIQRELFEVIKGAKPEALGVSAFTYGLGLHVNIFRDLGLDLSYRGGTDLEINDVTYNLAYNKPKITHHALIISLSFYNFSF